ncbi:hypothetical protein GW17_00000944 [Ensete ventricosum]|nr:hypothetical protein GW17_00000944 [Ensete ventricosum]
MKSLIMSPQQVYIRGAAELLPLCNTTASLHLLFFDMEPAWDEKRRVEKSQDDEEKWVCDSSVDHKGRVPRRASTGCWKASLFIIG